MGNTHTHLHRLRKQRAQRGFSLIELVVVVIIIAILAVIAIPAISKRMKDRRTSELAQRVSHIYRDARMRAMGRGGAVMVSYTTGAGAGQFTVREGVVGTSGTCAELPSNGCNRNWAVADSRVMNTLSVDSSGEYQNMKVTMTDPAASGVSTMDICYTPLGRTFVRYAAGSAFVPLTGVPFANVSRYDGSTPVGLARNVVILPNGTSRLGL
ncbi:MAG: prepilin-type N-terminal cleavage/methylation domain-containing protein [Polyangiaceae bacterium]|nr:prepilin-type N-terminal cleavage/methylation domain-containing protein [Polyangiaceae bacterium]MCB9605237.1 prepilin-type N-terminal cleavage/methylation domain-containing protein [Polyangiaceae bacterium]